MTPEFGALPSPASYPYGTYVLKPLGKRLDPLGPGDPDLRRSRAESGPYRPDNRCRLHSCTLQRHRDRGSEHLSLVALHTFRCQPEG